MTDPGPQKGPSSVSKIEAEVKFTAKQVAEILGNRMAAQGHMSLKDVKEEIEKIEKEEEGEDVHP